MSQETDQVRAQIAALQAKAAGVDASGQTNDSRDVAHSVRQLTDSLRHPVTKVSDISK